RSREAPVAMGRLLERELRPSHRAPALQALPVRDGARRQAGLRRPRAQRAPQHAVLDEPGAQPDGRRPHSADDELDQPLRHAAEPTRLAEEYAMLDVMSGGRLRVPSPLGTGMEYWANAVNPATARARFRESLDVILHCWTDDGPRQYNGEFYTYRYLNPWPKP